MEKGLRLGYFAIREACSILLARPALMLPFFRAAALVTGLAIAGVVLATVGAGILPSQTRPALYAVVAILLVIAVWYVMTISLGTIIYAAIVQRKKARVDLRATRRVVEQRVRTLMFCDVTDTLGIVVVGTLAIAAIFLPQAIGRVVRLGSQSSTTWTAVFVWIGVVAPIVNTVLEAYTALAIRSVIVQGDAVRGALRRNHRTLLFDIPATLSILVTGIGLYEMCNLLSRALFVAEKVTYGPTLSLFVTVGNVVIPDVILAIVTLAFVMLGECIDPPRKPLPLIRATLNVPSPTIVSRVVALTAILGCALLALMLVAAGGVWLLAGAGRSALFSARQMHASSIRFAPSDYSEGRGDVILRARSLLDPLASVGASARSDSHGAATQLRIVDRTSTPLVFSWIDYRGNVRYYRSIAPGARFVQSTYAGHAWKISMPARGAHYSWVVKAANVPGTVTVESSYER